ncbi:MAG: DUF4258 domain-containing protein [Kiritimatiellae bacterium]|jgi:hypothetical protein|nr:DUF4258 domain-containing protein [Kiritimatiellia bacterium]
MVDLNIYDPVIIEARLRHQAEADAVRVTEHAHQEMVEDDYSIDDVLCALSNAKVLENYPDHKRGACCLVCGQNGAGRYIHVVCSTSLKLVVIITVYEPMPPKWINPAKRGKKT